MRLTRATYLLLIAAFLGALTWPGVSQAATCARVRVQIQQELAFERTAFDAKLIIGNNLPDQAIDNILATYRRKPAIRPTTSSSSPNL